MTADLTTRLEAATEGRRQLDAEFDAALRIGRPDLPAWARDNFLSWRAVAAVALAESQIAQLNWPPNLFSEDLW